MNNSTTMEVLHAVALDGKPFLAFGVTPTSALDALHGRHPEFKYVPVATVNPRTNAVEGMQEWLEEAFELTNSIDQAWYRCNEDFVRPTPEVLRSGCRSTSVGDVVKLPDGALYLVAGFGWTFVSAQGV